MKLLEIAPKTGKYKLSHRVLIEKPADYQERPERRPRGERRPRPERRPRHEEGGIQENHEPRDFNDSLDKMDF